MFPPPVRAPMAANGGVAVTVRWPDWGGQFMFD